MIAFLRTALLGGLVALAGWWTWYFNDKVGQHAEELAQREEQISALNTTVAEQGVEIDRLEVSLRFLKIDHRVARIEVIDQIPHPNDPNQVRTRVRFVELGPDGEPLGPGKEVVVEGKLVYLDSLVIKFDDEYVELGDSLRGSSLCIFRRMFGEDQTPNEGTPLDSVGARPTAYGSEEGGDPFHAELWSRFWEYANDPGAAAAKGVRALQGEAPFVEARPGQTYRVELRASGGLTIKAE